jgi:hypothetical protein
MLCMAAGCKQHVCSSCMLLNVKREPKLSLLMTLNRDFRCCSECIYLLIQSDDPGTQKVLDKMAQKGGTASHPILLKLLSPTAVTEAGADMEIALAERAGTNLAEQQIVLQTIEKYNKVGLDAMRLKLMARVAAALDPSTEDRMAGLLLSMVDQAISAGPGTMLPDWVEAELETMTPGWQKPSKPRARKRKDPSGPKRSHKKKSVIVAPSAGAEHG